VQAATLGWTEGGGTTSLPLNGPSIDRALPKAEQQASEAERAWLTAKDSKNKEVLEAYRERFAGDRYYSALANAALAELGQRETPRPASASPQQAKSADKDRRVKIINATNINMKSFHASNTTRGTWEENILGKNVLRAGNRVTVNIDDGTGACEFDFLAVLANGRKVEMRGADVCTMESWTVR
jgi:hypothetical protein